MKIIVVPLFIYIISCLPVFCQTNSEKFLKDAEYYFAYKNYASALPFYREYLKIDSTNARANFNTGECIYFSTRNKRDAIPFFEKSKDFNPEAYFYLGRLYHGIEVFDKSVNNYELYEQKCQNRQIPDTMLSYFSNQSKRAKYYANQPRVARISNLGSNVNSPFADYAPVVLRDESIMFFTSRRGSGDDPKDPNGDYFEDIYWSLNYEDGWGPARKLDFPVNTQTHESCLGVSPNLSSIFFYRTNPEGTGGGVYESAYNPGNQTWSTPKWLKSHLNAKDPAVKTVCLVASPDSNMYYFVSNMPGGFGGTDIWRIMRFSNKEWSVPENLGSTINSPYDENSPSFFPDENTMYFSSKGHGSIGGFDVFKSENINGTWSKPTSLACPVNSVHDDCFFSISPDGKRAYFSTQRDDSFGESDMYQVNMMQLANKIQIIKGFVRDSLTHTPVPADITLVNLKQKEISGVYRPNKFSGNFVILVDRNTRYSMEIRANGYKTRIKELFIPVQENDNTPDENILLSHE